MEEERESEQEQWQEAFDIIVTGIRLAGAAMGQPVPPIPRDIALMQTAFISRGYTTASFLNIGRYNDLANSVSGLPNYVKNREGLPIFRKIMKIEFDLLGSSYIIETKQVSE